MKLIVKNFGAIKEGTIDLSKKVYLFVGYNNSGKTYMSKLIFKIFRQETLNDFFKSQEYEILKPIIELAPDKSIELSENLIEQMLKSFAIYIEKNIDFASPKVKFEFFPNEEKDFLSSQLSTTTKIGFGNGNSYDVYTLNKDKESTRIEFIDKEFIKNLPLDFYEEFPKKKIEEIHRSRMNENEIKEDLVALILRKLLHSQHSTTYFFPADRIFYLKNNDWTSNKKVQQLDEIRKELRSKHKESDIFIPEEFLWLSEQNYTDAEDILLTAIYKLEQAIKQEKEQSNDYYANLLHKFNDILGGKIIHELVVLGAIKAVRWKFLFEDLNKKEMRLELPKVSSAVNQLSTLSLYLEYFAKEQQNFLFIDEPEENLHPENQIKFLNLLLEFASMNENRLLMTTHSPLLAEHLNNYLGIAYLKDKNINANQNGIVNKDVNFDLDNVGVYFFGNNRIAPYNYDEYGVTFSDFNQVIRNAQQTNSTITNQIYDLNNQE